MNLKYYELRKRLRLALGARIAATDDQLIKQILDMRAQLHDRKAKTAKNKT